MNKLILVYVWITNDYTMVINWHEVDLDNTNGYLHWLNQMADSREKVLYHISRVKISQVACTTFRLKWIYIQILALHCTLLGFKIVNMMIMSVIDPNFNFSKRN